jgi:hypothetical protein
MPLYIQDNVPCSEMRGSNLHQGPRTVRRRTTTRTHSSASSRAT